MQDAQQLIDSLATLIWPLLVAILAWRLFPTLQRLLASRGFTVKVGQFEFTAQEATDRLLKSTAELQRQLAALDQSSAASSVDEDKGSADALSSPPKGMRTTSEDFRPREVLWVDDVPDRRAYEIAQLESLRTRVQCVRSTQDAMDALESHSFDAVVSNMSRSEGGSYDPTAGLRLLREARRTRHTTPFYVFSPALSERLVEEIHAEGGQVIANSIELFDRIWASAD